MSRRELVLARVLGALVLVAVVFGVTWMLTRSQDSESQFRQIGEQMQSKLREGRIPQSYMYVADPQQHLYWPNLPKYENAIPEDRRVYILNADALAKFKGYEAGPL